MYFAKVPVAHQVQGSSWIEVTSEPGGLVTRQGAPYLVTPKTAYALSANGVHVTAKGHPLHWVDVPEPSGRGVWHLAMSSQNLPLVGIGAPVYPSPNGQNVLWIDSGSRTPYLSPSNGALGVLSNRVRDVKRAVWAPDSQAVAFVAVGPEGRGVYQWDRDHHLSTVAVLSHTSVKVTGLGFGPQQTVLASFNNGRVVWQGHGTLPLPKLQSLALDPSQPSVVGLTPNHVVFWNSGHVGKFKRPDMKWIGKPRFSQNGQYAAVLAQSMGGEKSLLLYSGSTHLSVSMPFGRKAAYHLLGFIGSHWALVTVASGVHRGTYAWWVR